MAKVVYRYIDENDDIIKYVGIVYGDSRTLEQRVKEHQKDEWYNFGIWRIEYFSEGLQTRSDCEIWEGHLITKYKTNNWYNKAKTSWGICKYLPQEPEWLTYIVEDRESKVVEKNDEFSENITKPQKDKDSEKHHIIELSPNAIKAFNVLHYFVDMDGNIVVYNGIILTRSELGCVIEDLDSSCEGKYAVDELINKKIIYERNISNMSDDGSCIVFKKAFYTHCLLKRFTARQLADYYKKSWSFDMYSLYYALLPFVNTLDNMVMCNGSIVIEEDLGKIADMEQGDAAKAMESLILQRVFKHTAFGYCLKSKTLKLMSPIMVAANLATKMELE